jgi:hypothetical protein
MGMVRPGFLRAGFLQAGFLRGEGVPVLDADAAAYIAAVVDAGGVVSGGQKSAINTFYKTGKADGWYPSLKRVYLPIWGVAAPNAIDMIARGSGTFAGGVTHGAGFVQGNGTTGYFNTNTSYGTNGLTASDAYAFSLVKTASTLGFRGLQGRSQGTTASATFLSSNSGQLFRWNNTSTGAVSGTSAGTGVMSASRQGGSRTIYRRTTSSRTTLVSTAGADAGTMPSAGVVLLQAVNSDGGTGLTPGEFNNAEIGAGGFGLGMTNAQDSAFTASLKTLWEGLTGLTLP